MIDLHLRASFATQTAPFVGKIRLTAQGAEEPGRREVIATPRADQSGVYDCRSAYGAFTLSARRGDALDGDVLLCVPSRGVAHRIFRRASRHNTLLMTERCDQLCAMCSQPPKNTHDDWRFPFYEEALLLADEGTTVGISGGEPTLYMDALLGMLTRVAAQRPDLRYHILTNGQHFTTDDAPRLRDLHAQARVIWGVPLYSQTATVHDEIVGKNGAFQTLLSNLFLLGSTNARIELRTVITALNIFDLPHLANFIGRNIPFIADWAIMAMEPIGYALAHWDRLFFDHSVFPQPLVNAIEISNLRGVPCHLYNVPRCTVPAPYRGHCVDSISDWKKKYLPECAECREQALCSGFFEWYNNRIAWEAVKPITY